MVARDLMKYAPQALTNRGVYFLRENPTTVFGYPSKNAFYEEMTWVLWEAATAKGK